MWIDDQKQVFDVTMLNSSLVSCNSKNHHAFRRQTYACQDLDCRAFDRLQAMPRVSCVVSPSDRYGIGMF
jgi:hypothetical protein